MRVRLKDGLLLVTAESDEEQSELAAWAHRAEGQVFAFSNQDPKTLKFVSRGLEADACRLPLNITSRIDDPVLRLISNLAETPFELDGRRYASVEGFWQGLKFSEQARRDQIATLSGLEARRAGAAAAALDAFDYEGSPIRTGTYDHWALMKRACHAKFTQHAAACAALLGTGERPLVHRTRLDSRTIPGAVMAEIWMKLRTKLRRDMAT